MIGTERCPASESLHVHRVESVANGEVDVLAAGIVQALEVGEAGLAEPGVEWGQQADLPGPQSDAVEPILVALQPTPGGELAHQPMRRGQRETAAARDLGQAQPEVPDVEGVEDRKQPGCDGPPRLAGVAGHGTLRGEYFR